MPPGFDRLQRLQSNDFRFSKNTYSEQKVSYVPKYGIFEFIRGYIWTYRFGPAIFILYQW